MSELDRLDTFKLILALIGIVIALVIAASIVLTLVSVVVFLVPLFVYTSPAWLIGFAGGAAFIYWVRKDLLNQLSETTDLALYSAVVTLDRDTLRYSYAEDSISAYSKAGQRFSYATILCCTITLAFIGLIVVAFDYFHDLRASVLFFPDYYIEVWPSGAFFLATVMSAAPIGLVVKFVNPDKIFAQPLHDRLKEVSPYKDFQVIGISQLKSIESEVANISREMELPLYSPSLSRENGLFATNIDFLSPIKDYVKENQLLLRVEVNGLLEIVNNQTHLASEYRSQLTRARDRQHNLRRKFEDLSRRVARIPSSKVLRMSLEDVEYRIFHETQYSELLLNRKWIEWNEFTSFYLEELELLEGLIVKYEKGNYSDEDYHRECAEASNLTEDQIILISAYKVLGISPSVSDSEAKGAFRKLATILHPDKGGTNDDFNSLNDAWEAIKKERNL